MFRLTTCITWCKEYSTRRSLPFQSHSNLLQGNNRRSRPLSAPSTSKRHLLYDLISYSAAAAASYKPGSFVLHQHRHYVATIVTHNSTGGSNNFKDPSSTTTARKAGNHSVKYYDPSSPPPKTFIPRKAPLALTPRAREFLKSIISKAPPSVHGIMLRYQPSTLQGEMRMVFSFDFLKENQKISVDDEEVSLELMPDGSPKPPNLSYGDGMKKLYVHSSAFMKVLGATMDIELEENGDFTPTFQDREGNFLDPNA